MRRPGSTTRAAAAASKERFMYCTGLMAVGLGRRRTAAADRRSMARRGFQRQAGMVTAEAEESASASPVTKAGFISAESADGLPFPARRRGPRGRESFAAAGWAAPARACSAVQ